MTEDYYCKPNHKIRPCIFFRLKTMFSSCRNCIKYGYVHLIQNETFTWYVIAKLIYSKKNLHN